MAYSRYKAVNGGDTLYDFVLKNVRHYETNKTIAIAVKDGIITAITEGMANLPALSEEDGQNDLVMPPFVESHTHLDTVFTAGDPKWNKSGTIGEGISIWGARKKYLTKKDVKDRVYRALHLLIVQGVLYVRAHVDISDPNLTALQAAVEAREEMKKYLHLQIVAFPQEGIVSCPGNKERLEEAIRLGADIVGAIPHLERTKECGVESLNICFTLAKKYDCPIHIFCDEVDDPESKFLEIVALKTIETGMQGRVSASHANAFSLYDADYTDKLFSLLKKAQINVIACPLISSCSQGRSNSYPKFRGITRVKELYEAGINVSIAHDDILTPFYPLGTGNILQAAHMAVHVCHMSGRNEIEEIFNMVTKRPAKALQIDNEYGLEEGKPANFITLPVLNKTEAIRLQPSPALVIKNGRIIASTPRTESRLYIGQTHYRINKSYKQQKIAERNQFNP